MFPLAIANGIQISDGRVFDVSVRGCLVESSVRVKAGDCLQLRLGLPEAASVPFICVSVAIVRWAQGRRFGVEFIKVDEKYRASLNRFITHLSDPGHRRTASSAGPFAVQLWPRYASHVFSTRAF